MQDDEDNEDVDEYEAEEELDSPACLELDAVEVDEAVDAASFRDQAKAKFREALA